MYNASEILKQVLVKSFNIFKHCKHCNTRRCRYCII